MARCCSRLRVAAFALLAALAVLSSPALAAKEGRRSLLDAAHTKLPVGICGVGMEPLKNKGLALIASTRQSCQACKPGFYKRFKGNQACSRCPAGTYSDQPGAATCKPCSGQTMKTNTARTSCVCRDPTDFFFRPGSRTNECVNCKTGCADAVCNQFLGCTTCNPGYSLISDTQDPSWGTCSICPAGYYGLGGDASSPCTQCAVGQWAESAGSAYCQDCDPNCADNSYCDPIYGCSSCIAGYIPDGQGGCQICPAGTFSNEGDTICTKCTKGAEFSLEGSASCVPCGAESASFSPSNCIVTSGATSCSSVSAGTIPWVLAPVTLGTGTGSQCVKNCTDPNATPNSWYNGDSSFNGGCSPCGSDCAATGSSGSQTCDPVSGQCLACADTTLTIDNNGGCSNCDPTTCSLCDSTEYQLVDNTGTSATNGNGFTGNVCLQCSDSSYTVDQTGACVDAGPNCSAAASYMVAGTLTHLCTQCVNPYMTLSAGRCS